MPRVSRSTAVALLVGVAVAVGADAQTLADRENTARGSRWQGLARELALVRHLREHLAHPDDGLALSGDRRDLARAIGRRPPAARLPSGPAAADPGLEALDVIADTWHARVNDRTPFGLIGRDRLVRLDAAERALSGLGSRADADLRGRVIPAAMTELVELRRYVQGTGAVPEHFIDLALALADAAAAGRPVPMISPVSPGYGPADPRQMPRYPPPGTQPPPGQRPPPPPGGAQTPPPPPAGTSAPVPSGYAPYLAAPYGSGVCQTERNQAGEAATTDAMLRLADCWTRDRAWPGWAAQAVEALDWAVEHAVIAADCAAIERAVQRIRELGAIPSPLPADRERFERLAAQAESDRIWLKSRCR
jgi:hypothetical protein